NHVRFLLLKQSHARSIRRDLQTFSLCREHARPRNSTWAQLFRALSSTGTRKAKCNAAAPQRSPESWATLGLFSIADWRVRRGSASLPAPRYPDGAPREHASLRVRLLRTSQ